MKKTERKKENLYLSTLAFIDEDSCITNERYLLEFCKLVIYQNGYEGLKIADICDKINELVLFEYTEEEISRREKTFGLRKHIDLFCDLKKVKLKIIQEKIYVTL